MKPLDLQVNILKSLDLISEKAKESLLNSQIGHLEDKSKKERQNKDFHVPVNKETEEIKNKLPGKLPQRGKKENSSELEEQLQPDEESKELDNKENNVERNERLGKKLDIKG